MGLALSSVVFFILFRFLKHLILRLFGGVISAVSFAGASILSCGQDAIWIFERFLPGRPNVQIETFQSWLVAREGQWKQVWWSGSRDRQSAPPHLRHQSQISPKQRSQSPARIRAEKPTYSIEAYFCLNWEVRRGS